MLTPSHPGACADGRWTDCLADRPLRFAIRKALVSKFSSAIFWARLTSPVATSLGAKHQVQCSPPPAFNSWILKTHPLKMR
jgi:hypothetical protein